MIQLSVLSGKMAGHRMVVRHFPFSVGRTGENNLRLDDSGVWDRHLRLDFQRSEGFMLAAEPDALATVNNESVQTARLCNGDIITIGSVKIQFWLAAAPQHGLWFREFFVWGLIAAVTAVQFALIR